MQRAEMLKAVGQSAKSENRWPTMQKMVQQLGRNGERKENTLTSRGLEVVCLCFR